MRYSSDLTMLRYMGSLTVSCHLARMRTKRRLRARSFDPLLGPELSRSNAESLAAVSRALPKARGAVGEFRGERGSELVQSRK